MVLFKRLRPLAIAMTFSSVGLGMMIPILPFYAVSLGAREDIAVLVYSAFSAAAFVTSPVWGRFSDRMGRKWIIVGAMCLTVLSYVWLAQANVLWEIYAARTLAGVASGWVVAGFAWVADVTVPEKRAAGMGILGAAFGLGFVIGPGLGSLAVGEGEPNFALPCWLAALFNLLALSTIALFLRESKQHRTAGGQHKLALLRTPAIAWLVGLLLCVFLMFTGMEGIFALWGAARFEFGPKDIGLILTFAGCITIIFQGGAGRLVHHFGERTLVIIAVAILLLAFTLMPLTSGMGTLLAVVALFAVAMGLHNPAMQSLLSRCAPANRQGSVMGLIQSANNLARIVGPAWAGFLLANVSLNAPFIVGAAGLVFILMLAFFVTRQAAQNIKITETEISSHRKAP